MIFNSFANPCTVLDVLYDVRGGVVVSTLADMDVLMTDNFLVGFGFGVLLNLNVNILVLVMTACGFAMPVKLEDSILLC